MPKTSSPDATIHAAQVLIHEIHNTAPDRSLVTLGNEHKQSFKSIAEIFGKTTSPEEPPRVPIEEACLEKIQQMNKGNFKMGSIKAYNHPFKTYKCVNQDGISRETPTGEPRRKNITK